MIDGILSTCESLILEQSDILHTDLEQTIEELHYVISSIRNPQEVRELTATLDAAIESAYSIIGERTSAFFKVIENMRSTWTSFSEDRTKNLEEDISDYRQDCQQMASGEIIQLGLFVDSKLTVYEEWAD